MQGIILGKHVSVLEDRAEHLSRRFHMDVNGIIELADKVTQGKEGIHVLHRASINLFSKASSKTFLISLGFATLAKE